MQLTDILLDDGLVSESQLTAAFDEHQRGGRSLGRVLVDQGVLTESQLVAALAPADRPAVRRPQRLPGRRLGRRARARRASAVGTPRCRSAIEDGRLLVAMADPANVFAVDDIRSITGVEVKPVVATTGRRARRDRPLSTAPTPTSTTSPTSMEAATRTTTTCRNVKEVVEDAPIVKFVNLLITQAIQDRASDIHIEPTERDLRVRYRIDGVLHEVMRSPKTIQSGVISRLKIMADIDIAERRIPQDGRLSVTRNGKKIDLRVATLPTVWGEKIVMRILDNSTATPRPVRPRLRRRATTSATRRASPSRTG